MVTQLHAGCYDLVLWSRWDVFSPKGFSRNQHFVSLLILVAYNSCRPSKIQTWKQDILPPAHCGKGRITQVYPEYWPHGDLSGEGEPLVTLIKGQPSPTCVLASAISRKICTHASPLSDHIEWGCCATNQRDLSQSVSERPLEPLGSASGTWCQHVRIRLCYVHNQPCLRALSYKRVWGRGWYKTWQWEEAQN